MADLRNGGPKSTGYDDFDSTTAASEAQLPVKGGVATVRESTVPRSSVKLIDGFSQSKSDTGKPAVCFSELEYCDILIEGHPKPITALKDKGAEICLIREDIVRNWETSPTPVGSVKIRGIFGEPVDAELVSLRVKPHPGDGYENIAPSVNVIFAVCALATEIEVILCGTAVQELEVLSTYNVPKLSLIHI